MPTGALTTAGRIASSDVHLPKQAFGQGRPRCLRAPGASSRLQAALFHIQTPLLAHDPEREHIWAVLRPSIFVPPCEPIQRDRPPKGDAWLHEVKFDGCRMQTHKAGSKVWLFTRNGHDWT